MKRSAVLAAILVMLLSGGCVSVRLDYALDAQGAASAVWRVEAKPSGSGDKSLEKKGMTFARDEFAQLAAQWESRGIATETEDQDDLQSVTGRRITSGSREKSFLQLESWMKEEDFSPFSSVTANHITKDNVEEYLLDATIDWKDLVDPAALGAAPSGLRAGADAVTQGSSIVVSVSLPGKAVESAGQTAEANGVTTCTVTTAPGKPARIMLHTRIEKPFSAEVAAATPAAFEKWSFVGACGLAGLFMLIFAIRSIVKMARYRGY